MNLDLVSEIAAARDRIRDNIVATRLIESSRYSRKWGANVFFKCENLQTTGSFKLRGATNRLLSLDESILAKGVIAASTGNHGRAVAHAAAKLGTNAIIFSPIHAEENKLDAMRSLGAEVRLVGEDCIAAEAAARSEANKSGRCYLSPYNDPFVVAGQGTIGLELCEQLETIDAVFAATGGGGLISGIAAAVKQKHPQCLHVACSPEESNVMIRSLDAGKILDLPSSPTLSDATAGGVESDAVTFDLCRQFVNRTVSVSESEIIRSLQEFIDVHSMLIEGAAAVAIAAAERVSVELQGKNIVVILCGANIGRQKLAHVLSC